MSEHLGSGATGAVRVGDEVQRRAGPWTASVHALMNHARHQGVGGVPEVLGNTADGVHERLGWIDGETVTAADVDLVALRHVGLQVRRVHDALASFSPPPDATWRGRAHGETFLHGDLSPWNVLWRHGEVVGVLDWDQSGPGRQLEDLAYAVWVWVPIANPGRPADHWLRGHFGIDAQAERLAALCDGYGLMPHEAEDLLGEIALVQAETATRIGLGAASGDEGLRRLWWGGRRVGDIGDSMVWLVQGWDALIANLRRKTAG